VSRWRATYARELETFRAASPLTIAASVLADATWLLLLWAWLFTRPWLDTLLAHLGGAVGSTFIASALSLTLELAIFLGLGRLALRDVGLSARGLFGGLAVAFWIWLAVQVVLAIGALVHGDGLALAPHLDRYEARLLVDQVAGNALAEEVIYRGFLMVQLVLLARRFASRRTAWIVGLVASQACFALTHIPQRWIVMDLHGAPLVANLAFTAASGLYYALIYVRTGMLGVAIAYHALDNLPFALVDSPLDPKTLYQVAFALLLIVWPWAAHRPGARPSDS
jgi:membrane protease YdiL (CAAX protease family)